MKISHTQYGPKVITDKVTFSSLYLNGSYEFDEKFGSINASIVIPKKEYEGSELQGIIDATQKISMETAIKNNPKAKNQIKQVDRAVPELDDDGAETGNIIIKMKNKCKFEKDGELFDRTFHVVDGRNNPVEEYGSLTKGTTGRVSFALTPWYVTARKEAGITLWMNSIQILEPVFYEGDSDFDEVEGDTWVAPKTVEAIKDDLSAFDEL